MAAKADLRHDLAIHFMLRDVIATVGEDTIGTVAMLLAGLQFIFRRMAIRTERFMMARETQSSLKGGIIFMKLDKGLCMIEIFNGLQCASNGFFVAFRTGDSSAFEYRGVGVRSRAGIFRFHISAAEGGQHENNNKHDDRYDL